MADTILTTPPARAAVPLSKSRRNIYLIPPFVLSVLKPLNLGDREACMNGIIYLIGLIVVIMAILSFLGLR
jgi:hypothetical protein